MRVACWALHYGKEYLAWSVRSVQDAVDQLHVFYSAKPSYGFTSPLPCPDSREELLAAAQRFATKPVIWHDIIAGSEGEHRDLMLDHARRAGAQQMLVVDADELWDPAAARAALDAVAAANSAGRWLARFCNFWRSFHYVVHDGFRPVRIVDLRHPLHVDEYLTEAMQPAPVYHFGYAQSEATMRYKWSCHGHQDELRPRYLDEKFLSWQPENAELLTDLHPCVKGLWERAFPVDADDKEHLHALLGDHPYRGRNLIT